MNVAATQTDPVAPIIAVVGCDGSGKSTIARWLSDELSTRRPTQFVYFGTGDGPGSWWLRSLNALKQRRQRPSSGAPRSSSPRAVPLVLRLIWAAAAARERRRKMADVDALTRRGTVVVTDRYPQGERPGIHDGPRLGQLERTRSGQLLRALVAREQRLYDALAEQRPTLVLLLDVSLETAVSRRPEESREELERRIEAIRALRFAHAPRVVIDADQRLAVVQQAVMAAVSPVLENGSPKMA